MLDVFVSYRHSDAGVVRLLVGALERRGLRIWFDESAIPDFAPITEAARRGIADSKALLVFYSASYPLSSPCQWELTSAFLASQRLGDPARRILVVNPEPGPWHIEPVELRDARYRSLEGTDQKSVEAIAHAVARHVAELDGGLGSGIAVPSLWVPGRPPGAPRFVGRRLEMWRIHSALHAPLAGMTQGAVGPGVVQVHGLGGVGKSLLAREYGLRYAAAFPGGVFWLYAPGGAEAMDPAVREASRTQQLRSFTVAVLGAEHMGGLEGLSPADVEAVLRTGLERREPCLWVVDDLPAGLAEEEVRRWLGSGAARTLITTRSREYGALMSEVALGVLEPDEALEVLGARRAPADEQELAAAREIVAELGGHALALDVTAATLRFQSYAELLTRLRDPTGDELELAAALREALPSGHERSITATLAHGLRPLDEHARDLLRIGSLLAGEPIPTALLSAVLEQADQLDPTTARGRTIASLDQLASLSLIEQPEPDAWQIHPLVARATRLHEHEPERRARLRDGAIAALTLLLADGGEQRARGGLRPLIGHARALTAQTSTIPEAALLGQVAAYDHAAGDYRSARAGRERVTAVRRELLGERHSDTLAAMHNLASTLRALGEFGRAHALQEQVLTARRELLGERHRHTLAAMNSLAAILRDMGELGPACALQEQVLTGYREVLGEGHPHTLAAIDNLARILETLGVRGQARALQEQVLAGYRELLGDRHPDTLAAMRNLVPMLDRAKDSIGLDALQERARALIQEMLAGYREVLGERHPDTLRAMSSLGWKLESVGERRALLEEVLARYREVLGERHPDTLRAMSDLAWTLAREDLGRARALQEQVLAGRREVLGEGHPDTLAAMSSLASTLEELDELEWARALEDQAFAGRQELLDEQQAAMGNLAGTLRALGDLGQADGLIEPGAKIDGWRLGACLGRGGFGWVFTVDDAPDADAAPPRCIKVGYPNGLDAGSITRGYAATPPEQAVPKNEYPACGVVEHTGSLAVVELGAEDIAETLKAEYELLASARTDLFPTVYAAGRAEQGFELHVPYYVMERLSGPTLRTMLTTDRDRAASHLVPLFRRLLAEFATIGPRQEYAFDTRELGGFWHGDLKPENLILDGDRLRMIDPAVRTARRVVTLTVAYNPLGLRGEAADTFAITAMLIEARTGRPPFAHLERPFDLHVQVGQPKSGEQIRDHLRLERFDAMHGDPLVEACLEWLLAPPTSAQMRVDLSRLEH